MPDLKESAVLLESVELALGRDGDGNRLVAAFPDFKVKTAGRVAVVGPSGSGKSTLLNIIAGLLKPDSGRVMVCGTELGRLSNPALDRFRGANIGMVYQGFHLLQGFTVLDNVLLALRFGGSLPRGKRMEYALAILNKVGLAARLKAMPNELSAGERQRTAIARALAGHPKILLADEPTAALDPENAQAAIGLMAGLCDELGCTWLCVTHDNFLASTFPERIECRDIIRIGSGGGGR